ncbi:MAG: endonuclease MutS2 [Ruminococcaceae bacterium]|nr:endonuclease MutS2 [Oscillospiraceae bacterium]
MKNFDRSKKILEFDKILSALASLASTEGAKKNILSTVPSTDPFTVSRLQKETTDAKEISVKKGRPPFGGAKDITEALERAKKEAILSPRELLDIAYMLRTVSSLKRYYSGSTDNSLNVYFVSLLENQFLEKKITTAIIAEDLIADEASDELYRIRKEIRKCENGIRDTLSKYTTGQRSKYLQENIVTIRSGRYVVPVKAEHKNEFPGLVHDSSSSGATLFIEPMAIVEGNNKLRELAAKEKFEIERILSDLSSEVGRFSGPLAINYKAICDIDLIFARSEYSFQLNASPIEFSNEERIIKLVKARHPLLPKETVVPISLEFGAKKSSLVITGPNTGGKTVTLKTIGLMVLMAQSGLHLPVNDGTILPVFEAVFPDIGDEQSIEQSLSTFSSHMVNIVNIINNCDSRSLVLFDEIGAGTDPVEGAVLAIAVLEAIKQKGAILAATTHYAELKLYALENEDVLNASCEFDVESLKPTYRLVVGLPGKSNAFAISSRLGMPDYIIERAKSIMKEENSKFEDAIRKLEETESSLEKEKMKAEKAKSDAESLLEEARRKCIIIEENAKRELEKAKETASRILTAAKSSCDFVYDELAKLQKEKDKDNLKSAMAEARNKIRTSLGVASEHISMDNQNDEDEEDSNEEFKVGDTVRIKGLDQVVTILDISGDNAIVKTGMAKTKIALSKLASVPNDVSIKKNAEKGLKGITVPHRTEALPKEIDLRGQTGDDAWFMVDSYLDSAITAGYKNVTLVHGKGTGALKAALWKYLRNDKRIRSFRLGRYGEGDTGVTILELK